MFKTNDFQTLAPMGTRTVHDYITVDEPSKVEIPNYFLGGRDRMKRLDTIHVMADINAERPWIAEFIVLHVGGKDVQVRAIKEWFQVPAPLEGEKRPNDVDERDEKIADAIEHLTPDSDFTKDGKPDSRALSAIVGFTVTSDDRDRAVTLWQARKEEAA
jgi:hypothetical protein